MSKPMSKKSATILGTVLLVFGAGLIFVTVSQLGDPVRAALIVAGAGFIWSGTWVSTAAKAMNKSNTDEHDVNLPDRRDS
jgi:hypothetical protein